jgi:hypothetical protein
VSDYEQIVEYLEPGQLKDILIRNMNELKREQELVKLPVKELRDE